MTFAPALFKALKRDPTQPVRARVDDQLTVEVRAAKLERSAGHTVADLAAELGIAAGTVLRSSNQSVRAIAATVG